jgi:hypothetical protein
MQHRTSSSVGVRIIRAFVASYLILATLAGPSVCCCTVGRLAAQIVATIRPADSADKVCCCCKPADSPRGTPVHDSNRRQRDSAPCDGPTCPCDRDHARVGAVDEDTLSALRFASTQFDPVDVSRTDPEAGIVVAERTPNVDKDVFLNVDDLLRAMHFLRC